MASINACSGLCCSSYQTAWLKANHPLEFMAGAMNCDLHLMISFHSMSMKSERFEITFYFPCELSQPKFSVSENLCLWISRIKNVGLEAMVHS